MRAGLDTDPDPEPRRIRGNADELLDICFFLGN